MGLEPAEIIDEVKKFTGKQIVAVAAIILGILGAVSFVENRYAKFKETKDEIETIRNDIKKINEEMKLQVSTLSVLVGQMSAILNSGSGRVVQPMVIPHSAPPLTPEVIANIEASRPKINNNEGAVAIQNDLIKQQAVIVEQNKRLK